MPGQTSSASELDSATFGSIEEESSVRERPRRARAPETPTWLDADQQDDLRRFYRNGGSSATTRSTTAACLAIIEQRSRIAIPCVTCGGNPEKWEGGTGFVRSRSLRRSAPAATRRVRRPRKAPSEEVSNMLALLDITVDAGGELALEKEARAPEAAAMPPELERELPVALEGDRLCPDCDGRCWIVGGGKPPRKGKAARPIPKASPFRVSRPSLNGLPNVWPQSSQDAPAGYIMSEQMHKDLAFLGRVSHRIRTVLEMEGGEAAIEALGCYFAPDGGTIAALWHLVPAGKKLLRNNPQKLHHSLLFTNLRNAQAEKPDPNRALLFEAADKQSLRLYQHACEFWNLAGPARVDAAREHEDAFEAALAGTGDTEWSEAVQAVLRRMAEQPLEQLSEVG